jgi:beta-galactosidase
MVLGVLCALSLASVSTADPVGSSPRERASFDSGWKFQQGDQAESSNSLAYATMKPWLLDAKKPDAPDGGDFAKPDFDDRAWRPVTLPHDWGIEGPFRQEYPGETGKLPWWGVGWYRKQFLVPAGDAGRREYLDFDGAMSYASVWLNGHFLGGRPYGYESFRVDLTPFLKTGEQNLLAVRLDNPQESSRWYPGGGIYRNVWLVKTSAVHVGHWGVKITTPSVTPESAIVNVEVNVENTGDSAANITVSTRIEALDRRGRRSARVTAPAVQASPAAATAAHLLLLAKVRSPRLWSPDAPNLYVATTTVRLDGKVVDDVETTFGIRTLQFDGKIGLLLNGKKVFAKGVCMHHDLGALGAAFDVRAQERRLEILKAMGCNAIRTSHNPPAPELLDLCDRMGFLVMDEFTDTWKMPKKRNGYAKLFDDWHDADLRDMIRRDVNHPSIFMWSTGNEVGEQGTAAGREISKMLANIVHEEDRTRPVTIGADHVEAGTNGFQKTLDVFGYNYKPWNYANFRKANPDIPLFGSETSSTISSRGEYFFPVSDDKSKGASDFQVSSYDLTAPPWATTPDAEFRGQDENPFVYGEFVWTGFDYLGEPTPYNRDTSVLSNYSDPVLRAKAEQELKELGRIPVPSRSSYFGIIDLCGFPKDRFYLYQARWRPELRMAHLLPHWNWPERVGQITPVHLYTSGDEAELFLNGKSLGRKKRKPFEYRLRWDDVVYEPGELKAVVYKDGKPWAQDIVRTTGAPANVALSVDRRRIKADGLDLAYVTVAIADAAGATVPRTHNRVSFSISGPGEIVATDNGDPTDLESFQSTNRKAFNGLCQVIIRAKPGETGEIRLTATSDGLRSTALIIATQR